MDLMDGLYDLHSSILHAKVPIIEALSKMPLVDCYEFYDDLFVSMGESEPAIIERGTWYSG